MREELRARLETAAKAEDISLNAEIVGRLEESFEQEEMKPILRSLVGTVAMLVLVARDRVKEIGDGAPADVKAKLHELADSLESLLPKTAEATRRLAGATRRLNEGRHEGTP
jgi:hypothetical protein